MLIEIGVVLERKSVFLFSIGLFGRSTRKERNGFLLARGHNNKLDAYKAKYKILPRSFVVEEDQFEIATDTMSES